MADQSMPVQDEERTLLAQDQDEDIIGPPDETSEADDEDDDFDDDDDDIDDDDVDSDDDEGVS